MYIINMIVMNCNSKMEFSKADCGLYQPIWEERPFRDSHERPLYGKLFSDMEFSRKVIASISPCSRHVDPYRHPYCQDTGSFAA